MSKLWCAVSTAGLKFKPEILQMALHRDAVKVFCEDISGVVGAWDLGEGKIFRPHTVLHPEVCNGQVPDLA